MKNLNKKVQKFRVRVCWCMGVDIKKHLTVNERKSRVIIQNLLDFQHFHELFER